MIKDFLNKYRDIIVLAVPVSIQNMMQFSFIFIDQLMIGQLGTTEVAAVGIVSKLLLLLSMFISSICVGYNILISRALGAGQTDNANSLINQCILYTFSVSVILTLFIFRYSQIIIPLFTADPSLIAMACEYLDIVIMTLIPQAFVLSFTTYLRCVGKPVYITCMSGITAVCNTLLNYVLIFGELGFNPLRQNGAAISSVITTILLMILTLTVFLMYFRSSHLKYRFILSGSSVGQIDVVKLVIPIFINNFMCCLGETVYVAIFGHLGTESVSAFMVISPVVLLAFAVSTGLAESGSILISKLIGAQRYNGWRSFFLNEVRLTLLASFAVSVIIMSVNKFYVSLFNVSEQVAAFASTLLMIFSLSFFIRCCNSVCGSMLLASGYNVIVSVLGAGTSYIYSIPASYICIVYFGFDVVDVYLLLLGEELFRSVAIIFLFRHTTVNYLNRRFLRA